MICLAMLYVLWEISLFHIPPLSLSLLALLYSSAPEYGSLVLKLQSWFFSQPPSGRIFHILSSTASSLSLLNWSLMFSGKVTCTMAVRDHCVIACTLVFTLHSSMPTYKMLYLVVHCTYHSLLLLLLGYSVKKKNLNLPQVMWDLFIPSGWITSSELQEVSAAYRQLWF